MKKILLFLLAVSTNSMALPYRLDLPENTTGYNDTLFEFLSPTLNSPLMEAKNQIPLAKIKEILLSSADKPSYRVTDKVLKTIECARNYNVAQNNIIAIIDYSLPSSEKRLWIYDLDKETLLFHTYVSHGIKSGTLLTEYFSNHYNSKASSLGVFNTDKAYYGRHGVSLRLEGLDRNFNDNAANRAVVMHGGWYVTENFIKRYGRAGRSWGCPAVPSELAKPIIESIKENSLLVVYYPNENWFTNSKFLNCTRPSNVGVKTKEIEPPPETRENILFADLNHNNRHEESESIVVMNADNYERTFQVKAPLERMLRRRIDSIEYIALSDQELSRIANNQAIAPPYSNPLNYIYFVIPEVKMRRGYYATEMKFVNLGSIKEIKPSSNEFMLELQPNRQITLKPTNQFIRWLGL